MPGFCGNRIFSICLRKNRPVFLPYAFLTENPAKLIGVFDKKGSIADGKDADLVVLDEEAEDALRQDANACRHR